MSEDGMTTPTPNGEAKFAHALFDRIAELERDLAAAQEELRHYRAGRVEMQAQINEAEQKAFQAENSAAAAQEARQAAEDQVERLLLDSEAAHANLTALRDDRRKLQKALAFWMPCIASEDTPAGRRVAEEAFLLFGSRAEDDEPNAQELGWIVMDSEAKLLREERAEAEALAAQNARNAERYCKVRRNGGFFFSSDCMTDEEIDAKIDALPDYNAIDAIAGEKK